jgi:hypothetical protein
MENKKYPIGGFAPGNYTCKCVSCKENFTGDKRAVQCEDCAEKENEVNLKKELKDLKNKYNSWLKDLENVKLTKTINQEEVIKLRAKLELIQELEKKLGL